MDRIHTIKRMGKGTPILTGKHEADEEHEEGGLAKKALTERKEAPKLDRIHTIKGMGKGTPILTGKHEADEEHEEGELAKKALTERKEAPKLDRIHTIKGMGKGTPILTGKHEADEEHEEGRLTKKTLTERKEAPNLDRIHTIKRMGKGTPILTGKHEADEEHEEGGLNKKAPVEKKVGAEAATPPLLQNSWVSSASCFPVKKSAILRVAKKLERERAKAQPPMIGSFLDFLTRHARVKSGSGYVPYHFEGREALLPIVQQIDAILASGAGRCVAGALRRRAVRQDGADAEPACLPRRGAVSQRRLLSAGRPTWSRDWSMENCGPTCSTRFRGWHGC